MGLQRREHMRQGIDGAPLEAEGEVKVWPGRTTRRPDLADVLPRADDLCRPHEAARVRAEVAVRRPPSSRMIHSYVPAGTRVPAEDSVTITTRQPPETSWINGADQPPLGRRETGRRERLVADEAGGRRDERAPGELLIHHPARLLLEGLEAVVGRRHHDNVLPHHPASDPADRASSTSPSSLSQEARRGAEMS